jgi:antitoxin component HigA of HigAB toxin-antitoxin module
MGGRSRVSDFFNGRRHLSLGQIQKLRERFGVSADVLIPS